MAVGSVDMVEETMVVGGNIGFSGDGNGEGALRAPVVVGCRTKLNMCTLFDTIHSLSVPQVYTLSSSRRIYTLSSSRRINAISLLKS